MSGCAEGENTPIIRRRYTKSSRGKRWFNTGRNSKKVTKRSRIVEWRNRSRDLQLLNSSLAARLVAYWPAPIHAVALLAYTGVTW